jgi:hypothetical protein
MNMMPMQINVCRVQADMIFDNGAHSAQYFTTTRSVQLPEIPQVQYEVNDANEICPCVYKFQDVFLCFS